MKRRIFYFFALVSLLCCIAMLPLRVRSKNTSEGIEILNSAGSGIAISTAPGVLVFQHVTNLSHVEALPWRAGISWRAHRWGMIDEDDPSLSEQEKAPIEKLKKLILTSRI